MHYHSMPLSNCRIRERRPTALLSGCSVEDAIPSSTVQSRKSNEKDSTGSNYFFLLILRSMTSALVDQQVPIPATMATHKSLSSNTDEFYST